MIHEPLIPGESREDRRRRKVRANQAVWRQRHPDEVKAHNASPEAKAARVVCGRKWRDKNQQRAREKEKMRTLRRARKLEHSAPRPRPELCEICEKPETVRSKLGKPHALAFDHCHESGKFRGWICARCNMVLGKVEDSQDLLSKMIAYLRSGGALS